MAQSNVNRMVADLFRANDAEHETFMEQARKAGISEARQDAAIAELRTDVDDVRNILGQQRDATVIVATRLRAEEDRGQARDNRLDVIERAINRLLRGPDWAFIGGAAVVALIISRLFWHWVYFTQNWTFWLDGDYPTRLGFERHDPSQLMGNVWILSIFTACVVGGIAAGIDRLREEEDAEPENAEQDRESASGTLPPPTPPPGVNTDQLAAQR